MWLAMALHRGQVSAFILAGGKSSRMGRHKALLEFAGVPLIVQTAHLLEPMVHGVTVVGSPERYAGLGLYAISDQNICGREQPRQGALVGIASALNASQTLWNLILACDLPYLSSSWVSWLLSRAAKSSADIVMPHSTHGVEPLAAVYRRECAGSINSSVARGVRKVSDALRDFRVQLVYPHEWWKVDPEGRVLINMNTPADYAEARKWSEARSALTRCMASADERHDNCQARGTKTSAERQPRRSK